MECDICDGEVKIENAFSIADHRTVCEILKARYGRAYRRWTQESYVFSDMVKSMEIARDNERMRLANEIETIFGPKSKHRHRSGAGPCKYCAVIDKFKTKTE